MRHLACAGGASLIARAYPGRDIDAVMQILAANKLKTVEFLKGLIMQMLTVPPEVPGGHRVVLQKLLEAENPRAACSSLEEGQVAESGAEAWERATGSCFAKMTEVLEKSLASQGTLEPLGAARSVRCWKRCWTSRRKM